MATEPIIDPFDAQMPFPLDLRNVRASTAERDIIPSNSRYAGMMVYVQNDEKLYYLKGGVDNINWTEISEAGATVGLQAVYFNGTLPTTQGNDGDSWFRPVAGKMELYYKLSGTWSKLGEWDTGGTGGGGTWGSITGNIGDQTDLYNALNAKQATLVSGTNIKTVNGTSLLGGGDLAIKAVESIDLTSTVGLVDTYTVTYSDASTYQFTVTNGSNAQSFNFLGNVNDYASLPSSGNVQNDAWYNLTDELLYVYNGTSFPPNGEGISFSGGGSTPTLQEVVDEGNVINKVIKGVDGVDPEDLVTKSQLDAKSREYILSGNTSSDKDVKTWGYDLFDVVLRVESGSAVWRIVPTAASPDGEYRVFDETVDTIGGVSTNTTADTVLSSAPFDILVSSLTGNHKVSMYTRIYMDDTLSGDSSVLDIEATVYFANDAFASYEFWTCVSMKYSFTPGP